MVQIYFLVLIPNDKKIRFWALICGSYKFARRSSEKHYCRCEKHYWMRGAAQLRIALQLCVKLTTEGVASRCDPHGRFTIVLTIQGEPRTRARRVIQRVTRKGGKNLPKIDYVICERPPAICLLSTRTA